jgi:hypothetical protein
LRPAVAWLAAGLPAMLLWCLPAGWTALKCSARKGQQSSKVTGALPRLIKQRSAMLISAWILWRWWEIAVTQVGVTTAGDSSPGASTANLGRQLCADLLSVRQSVKDAFLGWKRRAAGSSKPSWCAHSRSRSRPPVNAVHPTAQSTGSQVGGQGRPRGVCRGTEAACRRPPRKPLH